MKDTAVKTFLYSLSGNAETHIDLNFINGTITYFGTSLKNGFKHILIDNIGEGNTRFSIHPGIDLTNSIIGGKTLSARSSIYIQDDINFLRIYFIEASTIEIVGLYDEGED